MRQGSRSPACPSLPREPPDAREGVRVPRMERRSQRLYRHRGSHHEHILEPRSRRRRAQNLGVQGGAAPTRQRAAGVVATPHPDEVNSFAALARGGEQQPVDAEVAGDGYGARLPRHGIVSCHRGWVPSSLPTAIGATTRGVVDRASRPWSTKSTPARRTALAPSSRVDHDWSRVGGYGEVSADTWGTQVLESCPTGGIACYPGHLPRPPTRSRPAIFTCRKGSVAAARPMEEVR